VVVRLPDPKRKTLGEKGIDCIFVRYVEQSKAYRPKDIIPNVQESQIDDHTYDVPSEILKPRKGKRVWKAKSYGFDFQLYLVEGSRDQVGSQYSYCFSIEDDPRTYNEAMQFRDAAFWKEAIDDEIGSIMENNTWVLSDLPHGCKPLGCEWIFKRKMKVEGTIDKFKARLVIQGFRQKEGIDYFDTYAPVAHITTIILLLALEAIHNLVIYQMDVKTAFLNGDLDEEVYMKQPEGFVMPGNEYKVCKLVKSLYGLKQAPKQWHQKFDEADNMLEKFKVIFKGNVHMAHAKELFAWTLIFLDHKEFEYISDNESLHGAKNKTVGSQHREDDLVDNSDVKGVSKTFFSDKHPSPNNSVCNSSKKENDHRGVDLNTKTDKVNSPLVHTKGTNNSHEVVKDVFKDHFVTHFKQPAHGRLKLNISFPNRLSIDQFADIDRSVSRDEIRVVVSNCGENKSPSPDGYTFEFSRRYWRFIGFDFCSAVECFFESGPFSKGKINIQKSQVLGVGVLRNIINQAALLIGCAVMQNPFRYLGVMVGDSMSQKLAWADTVQKLRSRLYKWKVKTLFMGGRLTLLKSVLDASPLYNMSIYKVPKGVLKEMEATRCNFFNGADPTERKITWVYWDKLLAYKKNGSLGVPNFHALNRDLLLKWVWHFLSQDGSLWYGVIQALYDRWIFYLNGDGVFRVKEVRTILDDIFLPSAADATRWVKYILIKINVFAWRARLDCLPTRRPVGGGIWTGTIYCPFQIGMLGFLLFGFRLGSS
nr:zinc finger, CCHC-type [Tanacetum cinerariifolium]